MMNNEFKITLARNAELIEKALEKNLVKSEAKHKIIVEAMRYSLLGGGKRLRGALAIEFCREFGGKEEEILPFCCAIEMIHAYSLIHDDLPCMDNDDMRRGKASCHKVYGESTAMLAGDALLTKAFEIIFSRKETIKAMESGFVLAQAAGMDGMIGGQILDLAQEGKHANLEDLESTDNLKTGALISVAAEIGSIIGGADKTSKEKAKIYAKEIGIAFQITDDILDTTSTAEILGKPIGSDKEQNKTTYVTVYGVDGARKAAEKHLDNAKNSLQQAGIVNPFLYDLADYILTRQS